MKTTMNTVAKPTANLAINKSRLKIYNSDTEPTYYLKDGTEFQLELFNGTTTRVLAKIELNGNLISQGGIVSRPGERIYLERYLDIAKKFLFETYEVEGNDDEVKAAIQNNGGVKIQFFNEDYSSLLINQTIWTQPSTWGQPTIWNQPYGTYYNSVVGGSYTTNAGNITCSTTTDLSYGSASLTNCSNTNYDTTFSFNKFKKAPNNLRTRGTLKKSKKTETGRIEAGGQSAQEFKTVDHKFLNYPAHTVEYKILPISEKVNTTQDIMVKQYCTNCGTKTKGCNFCSSCGTKQ